MLVTIERKTESGIERKKVHKEDLFYYLSAGWKKSDSELEEPYKKGRKRSED